MHNEIHWNERYQTGETPWDTGKPSSQLLRVLNAHPVAPCRALEIGCGSGNNSLYLAQQGFEVTGIDLADTAVALARRRCQAAGVQATFLAASVLELPDLGAPFGFFFDRGCYHAVRREAPLAYAPAVAQHLSPGAWGLVLAGNAREPHDPGPPVVTEEEIRAELGKSFEIVELLEFRFDPPPGTDEHFLAWSCLLRK